MKQWQGGVVAGLLGGAVFGILMTMQVPGVIERGIPALLGLSGGLAGWIIHMSISATLGVAFAAIHQQLPQLGADVQKNVAAGLAFGAVLWLVLAVTVMPFWLQAVGFAGAPAFPNISMTSLIGHLAYGGVLGAAYPLATFTTGSMESETGTQPQ
ncbi:DUF6789 family protein [Haloarchaeobius sp. HME9146]|uniref:DUF6789 family protein n=1 Tax=Haloarchaeobius sp. HME9146 TaxID=2978732 RepID=UPI0021BE6F81|nr:DUF6789 family protein [Haloarchaeobius sp. HME9146]MCT9094922.1 histidine kinase [Haloarchaeobius sp. HME9146]